MAGVNEDNLKVLVDTILINPVRIQNSEVSASASNTLFSDTLQTSLRLQLGNTLVDGLAVGGTLGDVLLAVTTTDTNTIDNVALLGLVAETAGLVGARGTRGSVDDLQLAVLPAAFRLRFRQ